MTPLFTRVTVAGVGLIGGSLALAARAAGLVGEVVGYGRSEANLGVARERGLVDRVARDPAAAVAGADLIVLAAPVGASTTLAEVPLPAASCDLIAMMRTVQFTPTTPLPLLPTAPIVPDVCVPCEKLLSSSGSESWLIVSTP